MKEYLKHNIVLITDKKSNHYGRIGFGYSIEIDYSIKRNAEKQLGYYFMSLLPDGQKIKLKDSVVCHRRFVQFKNLESLSKYLLSEGKYI